MDKLSTDLLQICLNAGLVFVLRWSLDDQTEQVYSAALSALANVLFIAKDQVCKLNNLFYSKLMQ